MRGKDLVLEGVSMRFGGFVAVQPTDLTIQAGEFFSILGPSGCGKTTILRMISGFLEPSTGTISIGGEPMAGIGPNRRPTALIFQNLALFPLMTVWENVAFGLESRGVAKAERRRRAEELLDLVALSGQGQKKRIGRVRAMDPGGLAPGAEAMVFIRPERIQIGNGTSVDNQLQGRVVRRELEGPFAHLALETPHGELILVHQTNHGGAADVAVGDEVRFGFAARDALALPAGELAGD